MGELVWTTDKPTKTGRYRTRHVGGEAGTAPQIVLVKNGWAWFGQMGTPVAALHDSYEWAGPIPEPAEANAPDMTCPVCGNHPNVCQH